MCVFSRSFMHESFLGGCHEKKDACLIKKTKQNGTPQREMGFWRVNYKSSKRDLTFTGGKIYE